MTQSPLKKYLHFSKRKVHSTLVERRRNNVSKRKYSYISIYICHLIVISFFEIQNSTFCQEQVLIMFEWMWAFVMCATCMARAMYVPRVRYVPCMYYVYGTCHACATCMVRAMHVPRVRYVPYMCHVYGTCHACATCTVRAMHVPRVRYKPCMCHVNGTCHACATCTVRAMHVPRLRVRAMHVPCVRYVPCLYPVYGTCHACATCTVRAMHVPCLRYVPWCARCCCVSLVAIPDTRNRFIAYICTLIQTKPGGGHLGCRPVYIYACIFILFLSFLFVFLLLNFSPRVV